MKWNYMNLQEFLGFKVDPVHFYFVFLFHSMFFLELTTLDMQDQYIDLNFAFSLVSDMDDQYIE